MPLCIWFRGQGVVVVLLHKLTLEVFVHLCGLLVGFKKEQRSSSLLG